MKKLFLATITLMSTWALNAQSGKFGATPEDSLACRQNVSIYQELYEQQKYAEAVEPWKNVLVHCPKFSIGTYQRGEYMLGVLIKAETDPAKKEALVNTLLGMYDTQSTTFPDNGVALGKKGKAMFEYNPSSIYEAVEVMKSAIAQAGPETDPYVNYYYYRALFTLYKNQKIEKTEVVGAYLPTVERLEKHAELHPETANIVKWAIDNVNNLFAPLSKCEDLIPIVKSDLEKDPDNIDKKKKYVELLLAKNCYKDPYVLTLTEEVCNVEPSMDCYVSLAIGNLGNGNKEKAKELIYKAEQLCGAECDEKETFYEKAMLILTQVGDLSKAKEYAKANGAKGQVYIITAMQIAAKANSCAEGFDKKAMYWLAYDYAAKAKSADEKLASRAQQLMAAYKGRWPNKEEIFDSIGLDKTSYNVPCWGGESTTVRPRG